MADHEEDVQKAIQDVSTRRFRSIRQSAAFNGVSKATVAHRVQGRKAKASRELKSQRFTNQEEKSIIQWINDLQKQHISPNHIQIREILKNLLQNKGDFQPLGEHFITRFVCCHADLKSGCLCTLDAK